MKREDVPLAVSRLMGDRPVRWAKAGTFIPAYDGHDRTLEVFNAEAKDQLDLVKSMRSKKKALEAAAEGPLTIIFHSVKPSAEKHGDFLLEFGARARVPGVPEVQRAAGRTEMYIFPMVAEIKAVGTPQSFDVSTTMNMVGCFRATRAMTVVTKPGVVFFDGISFAGQPQLLVEFDAYWWSHDYYEKTLKSLMREYKCKTHDALYRYFDRRDWDLPDPRKVLLPTLVSGESVRMMGRYTGQAAGVPGDKNPGEPFQFALAFTGPGSSRT